eukprot:14302-Pelagococcus_subviridis.AAC.7
MSYFRRSSGFDSVLYAVLYWLNRVVASAALFTSGWYFSAALRNARFISFASAVFETPRRA